MLGNLPISDSQTLQTVLSTVVDGVIIINERGIIQWVNPAVSKLFGYTTEEMIRQNVSILMPQPDKSNHDRYINNYLATGRAHIIGIGREVLGQKKNGKTFPFRLAVSEAVLQDGQRIFTGIIHDLTEIKEAQHQLEQLNAQLEQKVDERTNKVTEVVNKLLQTNTELKKEVAERKKAEKKAEDNRLEMEIALAKEKELNELKSRFVTMASHEFRTPLGTILSSASLIEKYTETEGQEKREKHINRIKSSVKNLTDILNDFLSLGKLEEGKTNIKPDVFDLLALCKEVEGDMKDNLREGQQLICSHQGDDFKVYLDPHLTKNIIINLISNAIKYSPEEKRIWLSLRRHTDEVVIAIRDEGMGIPAEDQKHLFGRFFRAANATNIQGTGLGLNIVRSYVLMMGGSITFESEVNEGTTFTVVLPIKVQEHAKENSTD